MITQHGFVTIPEAVTATAEPIKMLNYKTNTPARFRKNHLTKDIAETLMDELSQRIKVNPARLDYVYFSASQGAEPHTDLLDPKVFGDRTFIIPVILPDGENTIYAEDASAVVEVGGVYEFNHERTHSMTVADTESGCVLIMVAIHNHWITWAKGEPYIDDTMVEPWKVFEVLDDHSREETAALLGITVEQVDFGEANMIQGVKDIATVWGD